MADTQPNQAMKQGAAGDDPVANAGGKGGSESAGGAYPNPHSGKAPENDGFLGHGGQTEIAYHGTGQGGHDHDTDVGNRNAVTE